MPVRTVSGRLGHADAATTLNVYGHFLAASDRVAANLFAGLLDAAHASSEAERPTEPQLDQRNGGNEMPADPNDR